MCNIHSLHPHVPRVSNRIGIGAGGWATPAVPLRPQTRTPIWVLIDFFFRAHVFRTSHFCSIESGVFLQIFLQLKRKVQGLKRWLSS